MFKRFYKIKGFICVFVNGAINFHINAPYPPWELDNRGKLGSGVKAPARAFPWFMIFIVKSVGWYGIQGSWKQAGEAAGHLFM